MHTKHLCGWLLAGTMVVSWGAQGRAQGGTYFWDRSAEVHAQGLSYVGTPRFETALDWDNDGLLDLQINFSDATGVALHGDAIAGGLPQFLDQTALMFGAMPPTADQGAPTPADYNNDGYVDIFCNYPFRLYENQAGVSFVERATAAGITSMYGFYAYYAAWGDYDRDGWVDLAAGTGRTMQVFHNRGAAGVGTFEAGSGFGYPPDDCWPGVAGPLAWMDLDTDGDTDLLLLQAAESGQGCNTGVIWWNNGQSPPTLTADVSTWASLLHKDANGSVEFAEVVKESSLRPDIVLGGSEPGVWRNDGTSVASIYSPGGIFAGTVPSPQARILDYDSDGLFEGVFYPGITFPTQRNGILVKQQGDGTWSDVTTAAMVEAHALYTAVAADFDSDGDPDLLQGGLAENGQPLGKVFLENFYSDASACPPPWPPEGPCDAGQDGPGNHWLKVKLTGARHGQYLTDTVINADLIGSRVLIEDLRSAQWVQGVAASSSGPTLPLLFGLGAELSAEVTVRWPNGYETTDGPFPASQTAIIEDKGVPYVKDSTVQCVKTFGPGIVTFQFFWLGAGPATTAKVTLTHTPGSPGGDCYDYVAVLTPQSPDCAFNQVKQGTNQYTCSFFWNTQPCHPNCRFDYVIEADNGVAKSWSQTRTVRIASCIGG